MEATKIIILTYNNYVIYTSQVNISSGNFFEIEK